MDNEILFTPSASVGQRIKALRNRKDLTQKALGNKCGISEATIRKYELGIRNPKLPALKKLADALGVPILALIPEDFSS